MYLMTWKKQFAYKVIVKLIHPNYCKKRISNSNVNVFYKYDIQKLHGDYMNIQYRGYKLNYRKSHK